MVPELGTCRGKKIDADVESDARVAAGSGIGVVTVTNEDSVDRVSVIAECGRPEHARSFAGSRGESLFLITAWSNGGGSFRVGRHGSEATGRCALVAITGSKPTPPAAVDGQRASTLSRT